MSGTYYYERNEVVDKVKRELMWLEVLYAVGGASLAPAIERVGKHVACPFPSHPRKKKGKGDGFRLFKDAAQSGGGICATCGAYPDGFALLMKVTGMPFGDCLKAVGDFIGAPRHPARSRQTPVAAPSSASTNDEPFESAPNAQQNVTPASEDEADVLKVEPMSKGLFVKLDTAPYQFKKENDQACFLQIKNRSGNVRTFWGVDLTRAVDAAKAEVGDLIEVRRLGRKEVQVEKEFVDKTTGEVSMRVIKTHRNTFHIRILRKTKKSIEPVKKEGSDAAAPPPVVDSTERLPAVVAPAEPALVDVPQFIKEQKQRFIQQEAKRRLVPSGSLITKYKKLFSESVSLNSQLATPAMAYFRKRGFAALSGILANSDALRMHPALEYYEEVKRKGEYVNKLIGKFPTLLGKVVDENNNLVTLHRIYLTPDGHKAPVKMPKKMMPLEEDMEVTGCAIRLGGMPQNGVLGVAEGIETALAVIRATGIPCWSAISTGIMTSVKIPDAVHTVIIWADLDASMGGQIAAETLKHRLVDEGYRVIVMLPQRSIPEGDKSVDWNDVLLQDGILAFPRRELIQSWIETDSDECETAMKFAGIFM